MIFFFGMLAKTMNFFFLNLFNLIFVQAGATYNFIINEKLCKAQRMWSKKQKKKTINVPLCETVPYANIKNLF